MAELVGGFLLPHDPMIVTSPHAVRREVRERVLNAYDEIACRISQLDVTTLVVIGTDHFLLFGPGCLPQALIGAGDIAGPRERLEGMPRRPLPHNAALAQHLINYGHRSAIDWAVARTLTVDHSIAIPYFLVDRDTRIPLIPIYLACGVDPLLPMRRAREIGVNIREAIAAWPGEERVVILGSGGISHRVGTPDMGTVSEGFDREILDLVAGGDIESLCAMTDEEIVREGGNGALELRIFVAAMAAMGDCTGEVLAYEPVEEWITGLGFVELVPVAEPAEVAR